MVKRRFGAASIEEVSRIGRDLPINRASQPREIKIRYRLVHPGEAHAEGMSTNDFREVIRNLILENAPSLGKEEAGGLTPGANRREGVAREIDISRQRR